MPILSPSILSADFATLGAAATLAQKAGAPWLHFDVMDGHFVPNLTFGPAVVSALRPHSTALFDVHLMVRGAENMVEDFARAGANALTFQVEAVTHPDRLTRHLRSLGVKVGVALNPATPCCLVEPLLPLVDLVLVMSVNPGFGGQAFIEYTLKKIEWLRAWRQANRAGYLLSVDGGVKPENFQTILASGADVLVMGSALFAAADPEKAIRDQIAAMGA